MLFETYAQAAASLAYIRQITRGTCQLIGSPFIVGWCVVSVWFYPVSYYVAAFICYLYVCVSEQDLDLAYLWGNVCESCPFLVFFCLMVKCVLFYVLSDALVCVSLRVGSRFVGRYVG